MTSSKVHDPLDLYLVLFANGFVRNRISFMTAAPRHLLTGVGEKAMLQKQLMIMDDQGWLEMARDDQ